MAGDSKWPLMLLPPPCAFAMETQHMTEDCNMKILLSDNNPDTIYGLKANLIDPPDGDFGIMQCSLSPGETSESHNHYEKELFIFTSGTAQISNGSGAKKLSKGDAVIFDGFEPHTISNRDNTEKLEFLSIYWSSASGEEEELKEEKPLLVFATPPTPNGDLHLGHLSGPYLVGDVLSRAARKKGQDVYFATGRDDHQTYVTVKACELSKPEQERLQLAFRSKSVRRWMHRTSSLTVTLLMIGQVNMLLLS